MKNSAEVPESNANKHGNKKGTGKGFERLETENIPKLYELSAGIILHIYQRVHM